MRGRLPYVTLLLICANLATAALFLGDQQAAWKWGFVPTNPELLAVVTAFFVHTSPVHLLGNMFFLAAVGPAVEQAAGSFRMLLVFLAGGIAGTLLHFVMSPATQPYIANKPLIGASSAIAGLVGYYWLRFYRHPVPILPRVRIPVYLVVLSWLGLEVAGALTDPDAPRGYWAHLGAFVVGFGLALVFRAGSAAEMDEWRSKMKAAEEMGPLALAEAARRYLERKPNDLKALQTLAEALSVAGERQEAMSVLQRIIGLSPLFDNAYAIRKLVSMGDITSIPVTKRLVLAHSLAANDKETASILLHTALEEGLPEERSNALALLIEMNAEANPEQCREYAEQLQREFALSPQLEVVRAKRPELFDRG